MLKSLNFPEHSKSWDELIPVCNYLHKCLLKYGRVSKITKINIFQLAGKMLLMEHKKVNMFSHAKMADVKNGNQHLHFSENLKHSENLGMQTYSRFFKEVSQLNHSIEYCT